MWPRVYIKKLLIQRQAPLHQKKDRSTTCAPESAQLAHPTDTAYPEHAIAEEIVTPAPDIAHEIAPQQQRHVRLLPH